MNSALFLLINQIFFSFVFLHQSSGRFILIEVNKKKDTTTKLETGKSDTTRIIELMMILYFLYFVISNRISSKLDIGEMEKCLKEEGIPEVCLSSFKNGTGNERCNSWLENVSDMAMNSEARIKKCEKASSLHL